MIPVEVAYAMPERQRLISLEVAEGCSALEAVRQSGIQEEFPELDLEAVPMGINSRRLDGKSLPVPADYRLREADRVELYRPLLIDPKQARLQRARK